MRNVTVTVVLPLYNGARDLLATLDSIQAQTVAPAEVICVDDGSSDDSVALASAHPLAPTVVRQQNAGVAVARNRGAFLATSSHVTMLDQDDIWHERRLEQITGYLAAHPDCRVLSAGDTVFADEAERGGLRALGEAFEAWPSRWVSSPEDVLAMRADPAVDISLPGTPSLVSLEQLLRGPIGYTTTAVYERELYHLAGGCAPWARAMDDYVLLVNAARLADVHSLAATTVFYRLHLRSASRTTQLAAPYLTASLALRRGGMLRTPEEGARLRSGFADEPLLSQSFYDLVRSDSATDVRDALALAPLLLDGGTQRQVATWAARRRLRRVANKLGYGAG